MANEKYFYFGKIIKPHGYKGDLTIRFDVSNFFDYLDEFEDYSLNNAFYVQENENYLPYFIENIETKNKGHFKIKLEDIDDEKAALSLRGLDIYYPIEKEITDIVEESINSWIGFQLIDQNDILIGPVTEVIDFSGNVLLQVNRNSEDILIPFNDHWIIEINEDNKSIVMEIPEGLLELNEE